MTVRSTRQLLNAIAATCAIVAVGVVMWAFGPASVPEPEPLKLRTAKQADGQDQQAPVTSSQLMAVAAIPLRRSLIDVKPTTPKPQPQKPRTRPTAPPVNPRFTLLATVIEAGRNVAIISDARGRTDLKGVGETLRLLPAGARVREIQSKYVTIEFQGRPIRLGLVGANRRGATTRGSRARNSPGGERPEAPAFIRDR